MKIINVGRLVAQRAWEIAVGEQHRWITGHIAKGGGDFSSGLAGGAGSESITRADFALLVIAASTGGPVIIQNLLTRLREGFPWPIIIIQHMPEKFTGNFAKRLDQLCAIEVKEAQTGQRLEPGIALLAPGGHQFQLGKGYRHCGVQIRASKAGEYYQPSADIALRSVAEHFDGRALALILTGMGADGKQGVERLKTRRARIWAQREDTCSVYGMPRAVIEAGLADAIYSPEEMGQVLSKL